MSNFQRLMDMNHWALLRAVIFRDDLWNASGQIVLREAGKATDDWLKLPMARPIIFDLMRLAEATYLSSVRLERLKSGEGIRYTAADVIYEVVLQFPPEVVFTIGEERGFFAAGEFWGWRQPAGVKAERHNGSKLDQISLFIEIDTE